MMRIKQIHGIETLISMKRLHNLRNFYIGFLCHNGNFTIIKNNGNIGFDTRKEAEEYIKKFQPKYKHRLEVWHNI